MRGIRISIATITSILICIGIIMIFSSSGVYALQKIGKSSYFLQRHLMFLFIALACALSIMTIDYRDLQKFAKPLILVAIFLLTLVLIPGLGKEISGARRWFRIGSYSFQPSEFTKLAIIIYAADFLARKQDKIRDLREGFLPLIMVLGFICLLILKEPDLGTAVEVAVIILFMMFIAGTNLIHLGLISLLSLPALYWLVWNIPYRRARILAFIDPWRDSRGIGFQLSQSQIALGSGGFFGVGLGKSIQKLFFLPAAHTDFIFSIIGEELGMLGTCTVIMLFVILIWQGARVAKRSQDRFGYFLSTGLILMVGLQAVVNIGVSIGAFPTKGLPLPFISYGGSSLIVNMIAIVLLLNISRIQDI